MPGHAQLASVCTTLLRHLSQKSQRKITMSHRQTIKLNLNLNPLASCYKVQTKASDSIDWESVQKNYSDITVRYCAEVGTKAQLFSVHFAIQEALKNVAVVSSPIKRIKKSRV